MDNKKSDAEVIELMKTIDTGNDVDAVSAYTDAKEDGSDASAMVNGDTGCAEPATLSVSVGAAEIDVSLLCGVGKWRPDSLQGFANMRSFTLILSCVTIFGSMNFSYYTSVITQIEKRFGLTSSMTGFIKNVDNIGYMSTVLLFAHFGRYSNKPRLFAMATVAVSFSIFLFAVPHFIYGGHDDLVASALNASQFVNRTVKATFDYCSAREEDDGLSDNRCHSAGNLDTFNVGALTIFVISELLQGISQSPKFTLSLTYMDDNAKKSSPKYLGFLFGTRALAPVFGFLLGAWATNLYVDLSDPGLSPKDPRWIGAWWLGFVVCAACSVVWAFPMILFPSNTAKVAVAQRTDCEQRQEKADEKAPEEPDSADITVVDNFKDLPKALWRLMTNPVFVFANAGACFNAYMIGFSSFLPKYIEMHFGFTASHASMITGGVSAFGWALGPIVSGRLMTAMRITPPNSLRVVIVLHLMAAVGYMIATLLSCPEAEWAGTLKLDKTEIYFPCNTNCSCDPTVFTPVCGNDGINYYSPCFAGCTGELLGHNGSSKAFTGCACILGGIATEGVCSRGCRTMIPYFITITISLFLASMSTIPMMMTLMRCVEYKDKALSVALFTFIIQIVSFPSAAVFGAVIDTTCVVQQTICGRTGACLYYNNAWFHMALHGMSVLLKLAATIAYCVAFFFSRNRVYEQVELDVDVAGEEEEGKPPLEDAANRASPAKELTEDKAMLVVKT